MAMVEAKCTNCGAAIEVDESKEAGICRHCETAFITEKVINNYTTNNTTNQTIVKHIYGNVYGAEADKDIEELIVEGEKLIDLNRREKANKIFENATEKAPNNFRAWFGYAKSGGLNNDVYTAIVKAFEFADDKQRLEVFEYVMKINFGDYNNFIIEHGKEIDADADKKAEIEKVVADCIEAEFSKMYKFFKETEGDENNKYKWHNVAARSLKITSSGAIVYSHFANTMLRLKPNDFRGHYYKGFVFYYSNKMDDAYIEIKKSVEIDRDGTLNEGKDSAFTFDSAYKSKVEELVNNYEKEREAEKRQKEAFAKITQYIEYLNNGNEKTAKGFLQSASLSKYSVKNILKETKKHSNLVKKGKSVWDNSEFKRVLEIYF